MIRLIDLPGQQQTSIGAPAVSARALGAGGVALGDVATAVAGVSDTFHNTAIRLQRIENARKLSEKRNALAQSYAQHQLDLQTDPDPASRLEKTRGFLSQAKGEIETEDLPPELQMQLTQHFDDFATKAMIGQAQDSSNLAVQRAKLAFQNEITDASQTLDRAKIETALATAQDAGVILPEQTEQFIADFERTVTGTRFDMAIEQDPQGVLMDLDKEGFIQRNPGTTPEDIPRLRSAARSSIQRKRAEEMDIIEAALINGKLTPADLEGAAYLTPEDRARATAALTATAPPDTSKHSQAWDALFKLRENFANPAVTDEQYAELWNDTRSNILNLLPPAYQGDLKQELSYRSPANRLQGQPDARPDAKAADYRALATDRIHKAFKDGLLGDVTDPKSESARKAYGRMEDARAATIQFIKQNPNATFPEIRDFTTKALGGSLDDGEDVPVIPSAPAPVSFDTRLNSILGIPEGAATASGALLPPPP